MRDRESLDTETSVVHDADTSVDTPVRGAREARRYRGWVPVIAVSAIVILALGWTAAWYVLAGTLEARAERWLQREAAHGRTHQCGGRDVAGFPFRLEMTCRDLVTVSRTDEKTVTVKAAAVRAVAQVYQPNHVIAEIEGPVEITSPDLRAPLTASFTLAQASYTGSVETMNRSAAVVRDIRVQLADGSIGEWTAQHAELHARRAPGSPAGARDFDLAFTAADISGPQLEEPLDMSVESTLFAAPQRWRGSPETFREWQSRGGKLGVKVFRAESGKVLINANGTMSLNETGRLKGRFSTDVVGLDALASYFNGDQSSALTTLFGIGSALIGDVVELEGRKGVRLKTTIKDGDVRLGPIPVGSVDPLFQ